MKQLIVVRHAKSSWKENLPDHERPLNKRGYHDATQMPLRVKNQIDKPDLIVTSTANRAKTTAKLFIEQLQWEHITFKENELLYDFSGRRFLQAVINLPNHYQNIMLFSHNPTITNFVNQYGSIFFDNVPTCGLVALTFKITNWRDLKPGVTNYYNYPKLLNS